MPIETPDESLSICLIPLVLSPLHASFSLTFHLYAPLRVGERGRDVWRKGKWARKESERGGREKNRGKWGNFHCNGKVEKRAVGMVLIGGAEKKVCGPRCAFERYCQMMKNGPCGPPI